MALNHRQRAFVAVYAGNATEAARAAGYRGSARVLEVTGSRLLSHAEVRAAIEARQAVELRPAVADRQEVEEMLTKHVRNFGAPDLQLRAQAQLAKMKAWNTQKHVLEGSLTLEQLINEAVKPKEST